MRYKEKPEEVLNMLTFLNEHWRVLNSSKKASIVLNSCTSSKNFDHVWRAIIKSRRVVESDEFLFNSIQES